MLRLCALLLYIALESAVRVVLEPIAKAAYRFWTRHKLGARLFSKWAKRHSKASAAVDEVAESFNSQPDEVSMDALKGALKSKLIWLGVAQVLYGLVQLWADGMLTIESAGPVVSGALTMILRAVTRESLAEKSQK